MPGRKLAVAFGAALCVATAIVVVSGDDDYRAEILLAEATNLVEGSPLHVGGQEAGTIESVSVRGGRARIVVTVRDDHAPLRDGTDARIRWNSVLGQRILEILPGKDSATPLPDGALIEGTTEPVEVDEALRTLDAPTRARLTSLLGRLDGTLKGSAGDVRQTLKAAGPAMNALGRVLRGVGSDGPAIRTMVSRLTGVLEVLAQRRGEVSGIVRRLTATTEAVAARRAELRAAVRELPSTLAAGRRTLDKVPAATEATVPLLHDLNANLDRLPQVARNLRPVLADLRPTVARLKPTLESATALFGRTPSLLDSSHAVLPPTADAVAGTREAASFLRPYTPEIAGFFANWGSYTANYDNNGQYTRVFSPQSGSAPTFLPRGALPPGLKQDRTPAPGSLVGQAWVDAAGSGIR